MSATIHLPGEAAMMYGPDGKAIKSKPDTKTEQPRPPFVLLPVQVLARSDITIGAKLVFGCMLYLQSMKFQGNSYDEVCRMASLSPSKAKGYAKELYLAGILGQAKPEEKPA